MKKKSITDEEIFMSKQKEKQNARKSWSDSSCIEFPFVESISRQDTALVGIWKGNKNKRMNYINFLS